MATKSLGLFVVSCGIGAALLAGQASADTRPVGTVERPATAPAHPRGPGLNITPEKVQVTAFRRGGNPSYSGGPVSYEIELSSTVKQPVPVVARLHYDGATSVTSAVETIEPHKNKTLIVTDPMAASMSFCQGPTYQFEIGTPNHDLETFVDSQAHRVTAKLSCSVTLQPVAAPTAAAGHVQVDDVTVTPASPSCGGAVHWKAHVTNRTGAAYQNQLAFDFKSPWVPIHFASNGTQLVEGEGTYRGFPQTSLVFATSDKTAPGASLKVVPNCQLTVDEKY